MCTIYLSIRVSTFLFFQIARDCLDLPYVYGFKGPEKIGDKGKYTCYHGFVIDIFTNRKEFYLPCQPTIGEFEFPKEWPKCVQPKYCIGPAKNSLDGKIQPFPIRDVPILSEMNYQCSNSTNKSIFASCFLDGVYR